ncbi:MAG TPA: UbiD family decarboxylase [Chloroflexota bacterium]|jgi:4-hydroxy-3-polyprenylbenzoate decarboxylase
MLWNDLREYIDRLRACGDLTDVAGAHWDLEIGVLTELMIERGGPALLFDDIPDYPKGYRILCNADRLADKLAVALGLTPDASLTEMAEEWDQASRDYGTIPPEVLATGPVMENVMTGSDIDLWKFPTPKWHEEDGNRYIGTGDCVIQKDPDTGFVNVGTYRVAIHDEKTALVFTSPFQHGDVIRRKYWERGEKAPVVVSCGQEPILSFVASSTILHCPDNVSELEVAGYLHNSSYPVVLGPVTSLPMPATAEIVIEGYIPSPEQSLLPEGPFGEYTGYYAHGRTLQTPIEVSAIYYRNDPIIFGCPPVRPISAAHRLHEVDLNTRRKLEKAGIPGIQGVVSLSLTFKVVSVQQMYGEHIEDVVRVLAPGGFRNVGNNIWVLVDEDVDIFNTQEVLWAVASRTIPQSGVRIIEGTASMELDPRIPPARRPTPKNLLAKERVRNTYRADSLIINACRPYEWKDEFPKVNVNSQELRQSVEKKWNQLFAGT